MEFTHSGLSEVPIIRNLTLLAVYITSYESTNGAAERFKKARGKVGIPAETLSTPFKGTQLLSKDIHLERIGRLAGPFQVAPTAPNRVHLTIQPPCEPGACPWQTPANRREPLGPAWVLTAA